MMAISDDFDENIFSRCDKVLNMRVRKIAIGGLIFSVFVSAIVCAIIFLRKPEISRPGTDPTFIPTFSLNTAIDPCSDFYEFTCNLWYTSKSNEDNVRSDTFSVLNKYVREKRRNLFEKTKPDVNFPNVVNDALHFYNTCVNFERSNRADTEYLLDYLVEMGGWPILKLSIWKSENFDWKKASTYLIKTLDIDTIFGVRAMVDDTNSARSILYLTPPDLKSEEFTLNEFFSMEKLYFILKTLNPDIDYSNVSDEMNLMGEVEMKWRSFFSASSGSDQLRMSIKDLNEKFSHFDWLEYFQLIMNDTLNGLEERITEEDIVFIENFAYIEKAMHSLQVMKFSEKDLANLFGWYVVRDIFILIPSALQKHANFNGYDYESTLEIAKNKCFEKTLEIYECSIDYLYVQSVSHLGVSDSSVLVHYIRDAYRHAFTTSDWLDETTKKAAISKLNSLRTVLGFKEYHSNKTLFNEIYKDFPKVPENILMTYFKAKQYYMSQGMLYYKSNHTNDWFLPRPITDVSAYYILQKNVLAVPISLYYPPFYYQHGPWYLNFGALGTIIGHEFTHAFDRRGCKRGEMGDLKDWWTNSTLQMYKKRSDCFANQYASYYNTSLSENQTILTLDENMADNEGLQMAYFAYNLWVKDKGPEKVHPLFHQYSPEQMFFIAYGSVWCSGPQNVKKYDVHSSPKIRVIGVVSNSDFFARVFKCPQGSPMNPKKKCRLWKIIVTDIMDSNQAEVFISLYEGIENMSDIKELLFKDQLKMAVVNAELVYHLDQLLFAAHRSLYNAKHQQLKTKSVYTELLYNLFPSRSIRDSLKTFGAQENATFAIFVTFDKNSLAELEGLIKAHQIPLNKLHDLRNVASIRKIYKIPLHVTGDESVLNFILTKISSKELLL